MRGGFIKIYAKELGLDTWNLLRDFDGDGDDELDLAELHPEDLEAIPRKKQPPATDAQGVGLVISGVVLLLIIGVVGIQVYQMWPSWFSGDEREEEMVAQAVPVDESGGEPGEIPVAKALPVNAEAENANRNNDGHTIRIVMGEDADELSRFVGVWGYDENGKKSIFYEGTIEPGATVPDLGEDPWKAKRFLIHLRDASQVYVIYDGNDPSRAGKKGETSIKIPE